MKNNQIEIAGVIVDLVEDELIRPTRETPSPLFNVDEATAFLDKRRSVIKDLYELKNHTYTVVLNDGIQIQVNLETIERLTGIERLWFAPIQPEPQTEEERWVMATRIENYLEDKRVREIERDERRKARQQRDERRSSQVRQR